MMMVGFLLGSVYSVVAHRKLFRSMYFGAFWMFWLFLFNAKLADKLGLPNYNYVFTVSPDSKTLVDK